MTVTAVPSFAAGMPDAATSAAAASALSPSEVSAVAGEFSTTSVADGPAVLAAGRDRGAGGGTSSVAPSTTMPGSSRVVWPAADESRVVENGKAKAMEERRWTKLAFENSFVRISAPHDDTAWEHRYSSGRH